MIAGLDQRSSTHAFLVQRNRRNLREIIARSRILAHNQVPETEEPTTEELDEMARVAFPEPLSPEEQRVADVNV